MSVDIFLPSLGDVERARAIVRRAALRVGAYRRFLAGRGEAEGEGLSIEAWDGAMEKLPVTDKRNYLMGASYGELLADDRERVFTIFRSSGSSGESFYWPQLKDQEGAAVAGLKRFLEGSFGIQRQRTLAIVGLALGSWIGGDHISWALKSVAVGCDYPFTVFSPGNHHDEIIEIIQKAEGYFERFILFVCPSAVAHLLLRAEQTGHGLPLDKMRYVVLGEPFPEAVRRGLARRAGVAAGEPVMLSIYGSADTGVLGVESTVSAAIRAELDAKPELAALCGMKGPVPHLFHFVAGDGYVESPAGELLVTRWQGIPLVRYNLHDSVRLIGFGKLREVLLGERISPLLRKMLEGVTALPDLLAVSGRADRCLILCGTNLTEAMLDEAVKCAELSDVLTGAYRARIVYAGERQRLSMELEIRTGAAVDLDGVYGKLVKALGRVQVEFQDDWQNVYKPWDGDRERRIIEIVPVAWPGMSGSGAIKQRGIVT